MKRYLKLLLPVSFVYINHFSLAQNETGRHQMSTLAAIFVGFKKQSQLWKEVKIYFIVRQVGYSFI